MCVRPKGIILLAVGLPKLSTLNLSSCCMSNASISALSRCSHLRTLNVDSREIGDSDLQLICTLPSLTSLDFFSARITDAGVRVIVLVLTDVVTSKFACLTMAIFFYNLCSLIHSHTTACSTHTHTIL